MLSGSEDVKEGQLRRGETKPDTGAMVVFWQQSASVYDNTQQSGLPLCPISTRSDLGHAHFEPYIHSVTFSNIYFGKDQKAVAQEETLSSLRANWIVCD